MPQVSIKASDPYFQIYECIQATVAEMEGKANLPLRQFTIKGYCGDATSFAARALEQIYGIPQKRLVQHQLNSLMRELGLEANNAHAVLYIEDGGELLNPKKSCDIFFDGTSAQFTDYRSREPLYLNLTRYGGAEGKQMVRELFLRGYVEIPKDESGELKLGLLIQAYRPRSSRPFKVNPIPREKLLGWTAVSWQMCDDRIGRKFAREYTEENLRNAFDKKIHFSGSPWGKQAAKKTET